MIKLNINGLRLKFIKMKRIANGFSYLKQFEMYFGGIKVGNMDIFYIPIGNICTSKKLFMLSKNRKLLPILCKKYYDKQHSKGGSSNE